MEVSTRLTVDIGDENVVFVTYRQTKGLGDGIVLCFDENYLTSLFKDLAYYNKIDPPVKK